MLFRSSDLAPDAWRPPIVSVVATEQKGVDQLWDTVLEHRQFISTNGELARRREFRLGEELREVVARRLEQRARAVMGDDRWTSVQGEVVHGRLDPWTAADQMLGPVQA